MSLNFERFERVRSAAPLERRGLLSSAAQGWLHRGSRRAWFLAIHPDPWSLVSGNPAVSGPYLVADEIDSLARGHHDALMRTTLTIDDDLHALLEQRARKERRSVRDVVNEVLRGALVSHRPGEPFRVEVQHSALQPGIDPHRLNQLADDFEDEAHIERLRR